MYKIIPIILFVFAFAEKTDNYYNTCESDVCLSFSNFNESDGSVDIYMENTIDVAGYQIKFEGIQITGASGGISKEIDFHISNNENMILGYSLVGDVIPPSSGILVNLTFSYYSGNACFVNTGTTFSNSYGEPIDSGLGDCQIDNLRSECIDNDTALIPYDCSEALALFGCDFKWGESTIEKFCPVSCDACAKPKTNIKNTFYNTSWAVLIGINEYENIRSLRFAVQDAKEIRNLLITEFGFPKENVRILIDKEATLNNIRDDLYEIASMANEDDRILVYFAGHGETRSVKSGVEKGYLIPTDGNLDKLYTTCIPMTEIKEIANLTVAKHVLFLMDACFSGLAAVDTRGLDTSTPSYIEKIVRDQARQIITAGGKDEEVIEKDEWGHSAFAKSLISGLKSAVADQDYDGYITADELGSYLKRRVTIDSENLQTPIKARFGSGEGEFIFLARKNIKNPIIGFVSNLWGNTQSSIDTDLLTNNDIKLLYGENKIVKKLLQEIAKLEEQLTKGAQFIYGCMNENAINYDKNANLDDESCIILDSDDVYIRFGDFHNLDSTLDVFMASKRRIYNLEIITEGFEIIDVLDGNLNTENIKTSFSMEEIFIEFSDSLNGYILPEEESLVYKVKILPIDEAFCFNGLTINDDDTTNVKLGDCVTGLMVQELTESDTIAVEMLTGEHAEETGTILQTTDDGKYDILLEDSTIVEGVYPQEVDLLEEQVYSENYIYIKNVDYNNNIIAIGMNSLGAVAGFQFQIDGVSLKGASGGAATISGFTISNSESTVLGFSLTGSVIDPGHYTLVFLEFSSDLSTICADNIIVSDPSGNAVHYKVGECWVP
ncbi:MAG: caspase family protein [Candidatus Marinimicrobia bacterium]|nr:caspase family protein [Candidatus Neomarinimicrobiota bacterium]